jgi:hypothetical protein
MDWEIFPSFAGEQVFSEFPVALLTAFFFDPLLPVTHFRPSIRRSASFDLYVLAISSTEVETLPPL